MNHSVIIEYYDNTSLYGNNDVVQQRYLEDLVFYIAKRYIALFAMENPWFCHLDLLCPNSRVKFSTIKLMIGQGDYPLYIAKDYGTFCVSNIGKLCNNLNDFCSLDVAYCSGHFFLSF